MSAATGVKLSIPADALPEGTTGVSLEVEQLRTSSPGARDLISAFNAVARRTGGGIISSVYDFNLMDQDKETITVLDESVTLTVPVSKGVNRVAFIHPETGQITFLRGTVKNGFMTFETNVLGTFIFIR